MLLNVLRAVAWLPITITVARATSKYLMDNMMDNIMQRYPSADLNLDSCKETFAPNTFQTTIILQLASARFDMELCSRLYTIHMKFSYEYIEFKRWKQFHPMFGRRASS